MRNGALAAGGALTLTGRGDLWTLAIAFGLAEGSLLPALAVLGAGVATLARTGSASLSEVAGAQAVLGAAGFTGSGAAIGAAWASAASLVLVARRRAVSGGLGVVAGLLVAGPSLAGGAKSVLVWIAGAAFGGALGWFVAPGDGTRRARWQRYVALGLGAAGVALGIVAGYH